MFFCIFEIVKTVEKSNDEIDYFIDILDNENVFVSERLTHEQLKGEIANKKKQKNSSFFLILNRKFNHNKTDYVCDEYD